MGIYRPRDHGKASRFYWYEWWDGPEHRHVKLRTPDGRGVSEARAAEKLAGELAREIELERAGFPTHATTARIGVADLLDEYERELVRRGCAASHVDLTLRRIGKVIADARSLRDLTTERLRLALGATTAGLAARTSNFYRIALHGFFAWLEREGRWHGNPVKAIAAARVTDATRTRRAFSPAGFAMLLDASPPARAFCYLLAARTGLRRSELASLRWRDVDLEREIITVRASAAKNRKPDVQPLTPAAVEAIRTARGVAEPDERVMRVPDIETFYADVRRARARAIDAGDEGLVADLTQPDDPADGMLDFHALRATFATDLERAGVPLAMAQRLMRHSDPRLTANVYSKATIGDKAAAVARIETSEETPVSGVPLTVATGLKKPSRKRGASASALTSDRRKPTIRRVVAPPPGWPGRGAGVVDRAGFENRPEPAPDAPARPNLGSSPDLAAAAELLAAVEAGALPLTAGLAGALALVGDDGPAGRLLALAAVAPDPSALVAGARALLERELVGDEGAAGAAAM